MSTYGLFLKETKSIYFLPAEQAKAKANTVEPRYNESLHNEVLDVTNGFLYPSNSKIYEKELLHNETSV